jgi:hypothetical protein
MTRSLVVAALLAASAPGLRAQSGEPPAEELYRTISALDKELFASANDQNCDLEKFRSFFSDDVEFYHDQNGLTVGSPTITEQVKQNLCGKVRRELVDGTLEVLPMHGYGAVETGVHRFYRPKDGPNPTGEARFLHLWKHENGAWKITRVISYDHRAVQR